MRLGFVSTRSAFAAKGGFYTDAALGRLLNLLGAQAKTFHIALSAAPTRTSLLDTWVATENFVPLPWISSFAQGMRHTMRVYAAIRQLEEHVDMMLVQMPFDAPLALLRPRCARLYHFCADIREIARQSPAYHGWKRPFAHAAAKMSHTIARSLTKQRNARVISNGEELSAQYGGRALVSASLLDHEVMSVTRTRPPNAPLRILFVGYLDPIKGIDILFEAFQIVRAHIIDAELHIVGAERPIDHGMSDSIRAVTSDRIHFLGACAFGPSLFKHFSNADILVVPSRSEGTPRVLIEARAFGCIVIGTRVGGIPTSIKHEHDGLLIPPGDPEALAQSVLRVWRDPALRQRLRDQGIARAKQTTMEKFAAEFYDEMLTFR